MFINANKYIENIINLQPQSRYLLDYIHPNAVYGVQLYSQAVIEASD